MPKELTPTFTVISKACDGDETAISKILEFYDPFINQCCMRPFYDDNLAIVKRKISLFPFSAPAIYQCSKHIRIRVRPIPIIFALIPNHSFHRHADKGMQHTVVQSPASSSPRKRGRFRRP